jgi:hypothetical protein
MESRNEIFDLQEFWKSENELPCRYNLQKRNNVKKYEIKMRRK